MRGKAALQNIIVSLLSQLVTIICGFIAPRLIISNFGSDVNGLIASIAQFLGYIVLLEAGMGPVIKAALYKPIAAKDNKQIASILNASDKIFKKISYIFLVYLVSLCIFYPILVRQEFSFIFTVSLVIIISLSTFAEYYFGMTYHLFLQAERKTYITSGIQIITTVVNTIMVVFLIKMGANIHFVKLSTAFVYILRPILQRIYVHKKYDIDFKNVEDYQLKQKWDGLAQHIASVVHNSTDIVILTIFSSITEVSVYYAYLLVINSIKNLVQSFSSGIDAVFGNMIAKDEHEVLESSFKIYEFFYFTVVTILFICTLLLIVPFVKIYTYGITDANYNRPLFAALMVIAEFLHSFRIPYSSIVLAAGHFKETRKGACAEAFTNILVSLIFVWNFGIIGVALGTLVAMLIRTIEFMVHASKNILHRNCFYSVRNLFVSFIEGFIVYFIYTLCFSGYNVSSYMAWFLHAFIVFVFTGIIVILINLFVYYKDLKDIKQFIIRLLRRKR